MITFDAYWSGVTGGGIIFFGGGFSSGSPASEGGFGAANYSPARRRRLWRKRHRR